MAFRQFANSANPATTLAAGCLSGAATISVNSTANLPANAQYIIGVVTSGTTEWMLVTAVSGSGPYTLTVTRAQESSSAAAHNSGDSVFLVLTGGSLSQILTETNNYGLYANRPTSATGARTGMTYKCSDSPYEYVFNGSLWKPRVFGYEVTEPVLGDFTQVNVDRSTFDSTHGGLIQQVTTGSNAAHVQVLAQAIPGSGAYYVDAACIMYVESSNGGAGCGLSAGTLTSNLFAHNGIGWESGSNWYYKCALYNSITSWNSNRGTTNWMGVSPLMWSRVLDDRTTNRTFYISNNGYVWSQMYQEGRTTSFTPAQGILMCDPWSTRITVHWVHFSIHA